MIGETGYLNFDLLIKKEQDGFSARVTDAPIMADASTSFGMPLGEHQAENLRLKLVRSKGARSIDARSVGLATEIGEKLYGALFRGDVHTSFTSSRRIAEGQRKRLRIRLKLADAESAQFPWEYLRDPASGGNPLGVDRDTPLIRYMELPRRFGRQRVEGALRVLAVVSAPSDWEGLDGELEWSNLRRAVGPLEQDGKVILERLVPSTFAALERAIERTDYHIFHFVGHGGFDERSRDGVLIFTKSDGSGDEITSEMLGPILGDAPSLQLAVLNACEGALSDGRDIFAGCAQRLVGSGIPAVIAMQADITDRAAVDFSERFYESLAKGRPVDAALTDGRKAIWAQPNKLEWATPVLYMGSSDGQIFEIVPSAEPRPVPPVVPAEPRPIPPGPVLALDPAGTFVSIASAGVPAAARRPMEPWRKVLAGSGAAVALLAFIASLNAPSGRGGDPSPTASPAAAGVVVTGPVATPSPLPTASPSPATPSPAPTATPTARPTPTPTPRPPVGPSVTQIQDLVVGMNLEWKEAIWTLDTSVYKCCAAGELRTQLFDELQVLRSRGHNVDAINHEFEYLGAPTVRSDGTYMQRTREAWEMNTYKNGVLVRSYDPVSRIHTYTIARVAEGWRVVAQVEE